MSSPESLITKKDLYLNLDGNPKGPITQLQYSHRALQPPRLQTQVHNAQDLRSAVESALHYDGSDPSISSHVAPSFLPFSGNFILGAAFTLPNDIEPLFSKIQKLGQCQKTDCAQVARQLLCLVEEVDGFSYVRQGNGSQLHGLKSMMGWYFHYVCDASREHFSRSNSIGDCRGSIYISISTERIYIYYTHRDLHEPSTPHNFPQIVDEVLPGIAKPDGTSLAQLPLKDPPITSPPATPPSTILPPYESLQPSGRNTPPLPELNILPKIRPTPVDIDDSVRRNHLKLDALRHLIDSWLPEDGLEANDETKINPFLQMTFRFMVEWLESSMGHPNVQREIYKILDLGDTTDGEVVVGYDRPLYVGSAAHERWRQVSTSLKRTRYPGCPIPKSLEVPRRSVRDLLGLGCGTILSPIIEDPVKQPPGERKKE